MTFEIPSCIGMFDKHDPECTGKDPCTWIPRCAAFRDYVRAEGVSVDDWIDPETGKLLSHVDAARFVQWLDDLAREQKIKAADLEKPAKPAKASKVKDPIPPRTRRKREQARAARAAKAAKAERALQPFEPIKKEFKQGAAQDSPRKTSSTWASKNRKETLVLFEHFKDAFLSKTELQAASGEAALIGELYSINRMAKSQYVVFYTRAVKRDHAIVKIVMRPRGVRIDAHLPVDVETLQRNLSNERERECFSVARSESGLFKSCVKGLDYQGASLLADVLSRLINKGVIVV